MNPYTGDPALDAEVRAHVEQLDPRVRALLEDKATALYIDTYGARVGLSPEQIEDLKHEITLLIIGLTPRDDFSLVLMTELDMPPRLAFAVENWVTSSLLKGVVELLGTSGAQPPTVPLKSGEPETGFAPSIPPSPVYAPEPIPQPVSYPTMVPAVFVPQQGYVPVAQPVPTHLPQYQQPFAGGEIQVQPAQGYQFGYIKQPIAAPQPIVAAPAPSIPPLPAPVVQQPETGAVYLHRSAPQSTPSPVQATPVTLPPLRPLSVRSPSPPLQPSSPSAPPAPPAATAHTTPRLPSAPQAPTSVAPQPLPALKLNPLPPIGALAIPKPAPIAQVEKKPVASGPIIRTIFGDIQHTNTVVSPLGYTKPLT